MGERWFTDAGQPAVRHFWRVYDGHFAAVTADAHREIWSNLENVFGYTRSQFLGEPLRHRSGSLVLP